MRKKRLQTCTSKKKKKYIPPNITPLIESLAYLEPCVIPCNPGSLAGEPEMMP